MLLRSSSTPFLHHHHPFPSSSPSSLQLRRAFSDSHIPSSLHRNPSSTHASKPTSGGASGGLHTELSFSIYNTFGAPLASPEEPRRGGDGHQQHEEEPDLLPHQQQRGGAVQQPDHPEVPLFLARGLGIDRIASGFFTAGGDKAKGAGAGAKAMEGVEERDEAAAAAALLDARYKRMVDEQPGNALFLRNYAQFLHEVKGDARRAEEYYSRAMLADPGDGEVMSQYAKLVWEVYRESATRRGASATSTSRCRPPRRTAMSSPRTPASCGSRTTTTSGKAWVELEHRSSKLHIRIRQGK
ncbi:unnamed protein product [Urochloa humidicola]